MIASLQAKLKASYSMRTSFLGPAPETPGDVLPILYGNLAYGPVGGISFMPCIDTAANKYVIADHAIVSAANGNSPTFYAANTSEQTVIVPTSWNDADTLAGRTMATATFGSSYVGSRVGYRGYGACDDAGALIYNPVSVAIHFCKTFLGIVDAEINLPVVEIARGRAGILPYLCAGVIDADFTPDTMLARMLSCFSASFRVDAGGQLQILLDDAAVPGREGMAAIIRKQDLGDDAKATWDRADLINQVVVRYQRNAYNRFLQSPYMAKEDGEATKDLLSQSLHGPLGPGIGSVAPYDFDWTGDLSTVQAVQANIVLRMATARPKVSFTVPTLRCAHVEPGDYVAYSWRHMYDKYGRQMQNQIGIAEATGQGPDDQTMSLTVRDTGGFLAAAWIADATINADGYGQAGGDRDPRDWA